MAELAITYADDACAVGTLGNVCAVVWRGECTTARNTEWFSAAHGLARRLGTPIAVIAVVTKNAPTPAGEVRTAQSRFLEELSRIAVAAGVILDGVGFRASLVRAVVASITAPARYRCPVRVTSTDAEMARWLHGRAVSLPPSAVRADEKQISSLLATLRARLLP